MVKRTPYCNRWLTSGETGEGRLLLQDPPTCCHADGERRHQRDSRSLRMPRLLFFSPACRRQLPNHIEVGVTTQLTLIGVVID
eukprot:scaffold7806_cov72-Skeletonema_dohrnii-CCMP3373.AAC.1